MGFWPKRGGKLSITRKCTPNILNTGLLQSLIMQLRPPFLIAIIVFCSNANFHQYLEKITYAYICIFKDVGNL